MSDPWLCLRAEKNMQRIRTSAAFLIFEAGIAVPRLNLRGVDFEAKKNLVVQEAVEEVGWTVWSSRKRKDSWVRDVVC